MDLEGTSTILKESRFIMVVKQSHPKKKIDHYRLISSGSIKEQPATEHIFNEVESGIESILNDVPIRNKFSMEINVSSMMANKDPKAMLSRILKMQKLKSSLADRVTTMTLICPNYIKDVLKIFAKLHFKQIDIQVIGIEN